MISLYKGRFVCDVVFAGLAASVLVTPVSAQDSNAGLEEIVVTAQRRTEDLQDVPLSVTAFDSTQIEKLQITNTTSIGQFVPNLVTRQATGQGATGQFHLRGAGQGDSLPSLEPGIGVYLDDVYIARITNFDFALKDIESIEVLRGPQGTLYGRNSVGGAIKIITARPDPAETLTRLEAGIGNLDSYELFGMHNQPLGEATSFRISAGYWVQDEGYVKAPNLAEGDVNTEERMSVRASLLTQPVDELSVLFRVDYSKMDTACCNGANLGDTIVTLPDGERDSLKDYDRSSFFTYTGNDKPVSDSDGLGVSVDVSYDWNEVTLRSITGYRDTSSDLSLDFNIAGLILIQSLESTQFSQEFQLQGQMMSDRVDWLLGAYYFNENSDWFTSLGIPASNTSLGSELLNTGTDAYAIFGNLNYALTDRLRALFGLRYTYERKDVSASGYSDFDAQVGPVWTDATLDTNEVPRNLDFENLDPKIGLEFDFTNEVMGYISYSEGFKSGGWSARVWANPTSFSAVEEEQIEAMEIGLKSMLLENRLRLNVAAFWNDYNDLVVNRVATLPNGATGTIASNAAAAEANGVEFEAQLQITDNLTASGSYSYLDTEITSVVGDTGFVTVGDPLQVSPKNQYTLALDGDWPLNVLSGLISARIGLSYRSANYNGAAAEPAQRIESIELLDFIAGYEPDNGSWYGQIYCRNCADEKYWEGRFSTGVWPAYVGLPRTYGVRVGLRF